LVELGMQKKKKKKKKPEADVFQPIRSK
jgi:hypothetical protein